jgi:hypothetical protein
MLISHCLSRLLATQQLPYQQKLHTLVMLAMKVRLRGALLVRERR